MPTLELSEAQVAQLVRQLPAAKRREVLLALAGPAAAREARLDAAEVAARRLAAARGMDWEKLSDDERLAFVDDLIHEDRP